MIHLPGTGTTWNSIGAIRASSRLFLVVSTDDETGPSRAVGVDYNLVVPMTAVCVLQVYEVIPNSSIPAFFFCFPVNSRLPCRNEGRPFNPMQWKESLQNRFSVCAITVVAAARIREGRSHGAIVQIRTLDQIWEIQQSSTISSSLSLASMQQGS